MLRALRVRVTLLLACEDFGCFLKNNRQAKMCYKEKMVGTCNHNDELLYYVDGAS